VQKQQYLINGYGLNKRQARRLLVSIGVKPDGKRPGK
jgi:hypothetical protein